MKIRFYKRQEIANDKWDALIDASFNGSIYAKSWYLDSTCKHWGAFIAENYTIAMPVPYVKKYGLRFVLAPFFLQQLGVFSKEQLSSDTIALFEKRLRLFSPYVSYSFNSSFAAYSFLLSRDQKANHTINIACSYEELFKNYRRNTKRNLKKGVNAGLVVKSSEQIDAYLTLVRASLHTEVEGIKPYHYDNIRKIAEESFARKCGELLEVTNSEGAMVAIGFFVQHRGRHTFLVCASSEEGKKNNAMYLIVDAYLKKHAGNAETFDFSGSNIPGVAYFNEGFGAVDVPYFVVNSRFFR